MPQGQLARVDSTTQLFGLKEYCGGSVGSTSNSADSLGEHEVAWLRRIGARRGRYDVKLRGGKRVCRTEIEPCQRASVCRVYEAIVSALMKARENELRIDETMSRGDLTTLVR